jgi:rSAM/selenodomain-associated transferase 2
MRIAIIIPTLNEAALIGKTIQILRLLPTEHLTMEIIVADGGSNDETREIAADCLAQVICAPRGRGSQMNIAARSTSAEVLLFLHADTQLPMDALTRVEETLRDAAVCGGNFSLLFRGDTWGARLLTQLYPLLRRGGMCYGDSGFFVRRAVFESVGGFREIPLFEDCDLFQRLRRCGKFVRIEARATTSSRRFENRFLRTFALWATLQCLYWLGVNPHLLSRFYKPVRERA